MFLERLNSIKSRYVFLLLSILGLIIYWPSLKGGPIWDDEYRLFKDYIYLKLDVVDYWNFKFRWPLFNSITNILLKVFGENYLAFRLINLFTFSICTTLLFKVLTKLKFKYALLTSLIFFVHPMNVQNAAWIIQLKSLVSFCFILLSTLFFMRENKSWKINFLSLFFYVCSLLTKSFLIHFPFYLLLYLFLKKKGSVKQLIPFFLAMILFIPFFISAKHNRKSSDNAKFDLKREMTLSQLNKGLVLSRKAEESYNKSVINERKKPEKKQPVKKKVEKYFRLTGGNLIIDSVHDFSKLQHLDKKKREQIINFFNKNKKNKKKKEIKEVKLNAWSMLYNRSILVAKTSLYYLTTGLYPIHLAGYYEKFDLIQNNKNDYLLIFFLLLVLVVYIFGVKICINRKAHVLELTLLLTLISIMPVVGIVIGPFMNLTHISDHHFLYGLIFYIPFMLLLVERLLRNVKIILTIISVSIMIIFSILSYRHSITFFNNENFF
ncbi:MAG: hypothetical protein ACI9QD_001256, partial [Thermoproteota archaeon]